MRLLTTTTGLQVGQLLEGQDGQQVNQLDTNEPVALTTKRQGMTDQGKTVVNALLILHQQRQACGHSCQRSLHADGVR